MKFELYITCDNAAFGETDEDRTREIARILRKTALRIMEDLEPARVIMDTNGNKVGKCYTTPRDLAGALLAALQQIADQHGSREHSRHEATEMARIAREAIALAAEIAE